MVDLDLLRQYWQGRRTVNAVIARVVLLDLTSPKDQRAVEEHKQVLFAKQSHHGHWNESLVQTAHAIDQLLWLGVERDHERLGRAFTWLLSQCSDSAVVPGLPVPSDRELKNDPKLYTGQPPGATGSIEFQLGILGMRALWLLSGDGEQFATVDDRLFELLTRPPSWMCSLTLSTAYFAIAANQKLSQGPFIAEGLSKLLATQRKPGAWKGTMKPWYMYYCLSEWPGAPARRLVNTDNTFLERAQKRDGSFSRGFFTEERTFAVTKLLKAAGLTE